MPGVQSLDPPSSQIIGSISVSNDRWVKVEEPQLLSSLAISQLNEYEEFL